MHSSQSQIRSPIVFTPTSDIALSDIENATPGSTLSSKKFSERVPKVYG